MGGHISERLAHLLASLGIGERLDDLPHSRRAIRDAVNGLTRPVVGTARKGTEDVAEAGLLRRRGLLTALAAATTTTKVIWSGVRAAPPSSNRIRHG